MGTWLGGGWGVGRDRQTTCSLVLVESVEMEDEVSRLWTREPQS